MRASFEKNKKGILLMLAASLCVCVGQLCWKLSGQRGPLFLLLGFGLYGLGALITLTAYRYGSLSVLQPVLSLNYVLTVVLAALVLKEEITPLRAAGILCVMGGVVLICGGDGEEGAA
jgi:undecaprenyl phosphate-alpha-L-ara4N flippase subunit ArnE